MLLRQSVFLSSHFLPSLLVHFFRQGSQQHLSKICSLPHLNRSLAFRLPSEIPNLTVCSSSSDGAGMPLMPPHYLGSSCSLGWGHSPHFLLHPSNLSSGAGSSRKPSLTPPHATSPLPGSRPLFCEPIIFNAPLRHLRPLRLVLRAPRRAE